MDTVYTLSPKGQRECAAEPPMLLRELHELLRLVDGRRTRAELLACVGKNAVTTGGLRWLMASGYIHPTSATAPHGLEAGDRNTAAVAPSGLLPSVPQDLSSRAAPVSQRGELGVHEALADHMLHSVGRHLGEVGGPYRWRIERATHVAELLPLLNPLLEAILARAGSESAVEFADAAARLLQPLDECVQ
ncbi:MAG: hypothetical protein R3E52_05705 [Burkholderiaceae bacterium]